MDLVVLAAYLLVGAGYSSIMMEETETPPRLAKWKVGVGGALLATLWPIKASLDLIALVPGAKKRFKII